MDNSQVEHLIASTGCNRSSSNSNESVHRRSLSNEPLKLEKTSAPQTPKPPTPTASYSPLSRNDTYCWICHLDIDVINCYACPRAYHLKCIGLANQIPNWICQECKKNERAKNERKILNQVTQEQFQMMLDNAINRLKYPDSVIFQQKVDQTLFPEYAHFVVYPMDLSVMENKIKENEYISLEEFLSDLKWIVHNCTVFNGIQSKLTAVAKSLLRMLKHEINEMDVCPDCYLNSIMKNNDNWFCEPCRVPHPLIWAKMKGFPYWPGKALRIVNDEVDVRFFGAHDRAWIPLANCYWLSKEFPKSKVRTSVSNLDSSIVELHGHIERLTQKYGEFLYAPLKTLIEPDKLFNELPSLANQCCLPVIKDGFRKSRSNSFNYGSNERLASNDTNSNNNDTVNDNQSDAGTQAQTTVFVFRKRKGKRRRRIVTPAKISTSNEQIKKRKNSSQRASITDETGSIGSSKSFDESLNTSSCQTKLPKQEEFSPTPSVSSLLNQFTSSSPLAVNESRDTGNTGLTAVGEAAATTPDFELCEVKFDPRNGNIFKTLALESDKVNEQPKSGDNAQNGANVGDIDDNASMEYRPSTSKLIDSKKPSSIESETNVNLKNAKTSLAVNEPKRGSPARFENNYKKEMDAMRKEFEKLVKEIQYNSDLKIKEISSECVKEKAKMQQKFEKQIEDVKKKQWCANCAKEAIYYCCWNTSYCDEDCQRSHWNIHMNNCLRGKIIAESAQQQNNSTA